MNDNMVLGMAKNIFEKPTLFVKISEKLWNFISEKKTNCKSIIIVQHGVKHFNHMMKHRISLWLK